MSKLRVVSKSEQMIVNLYLNTAFLRFYNIEKLEMNVLSKTWPFWFNSYLKASSIRKPEFVDEFPCDENYNKIFVREWLAHGPVWALIGQFWGHAWNSPSGLKKVKIKRSLAYVDVFSFQSP